MSAALAHYTELLTEKEICSDSRLGMLIGLAELRQARRAHSIKFIVGKRGTHLYHPDAIAAYLAQK